MAFTKTWKCKGGSFSTSCLHARHSKVKTYYVNRDNELTGKAYCTTSKKKKLVQKAFSNRPCGSLWEGADGRGESTIV